MLLDLDGTLYRCDRLQSRYDRALLGLVAGHVGRSPGEVERALRSVMAAYAGLGLSPAMTSFVGTVGLGLDDWYRVSVDQVDPRDYLAPDPDLQACLETLASNAVLAVVTNNCETQVRRTLQALDILHLFSHTFSPRSLDEIKPARAMFHRALEVLNLPAHSCLMIGDREQVDLVPAGRLGMETAAVSGPGELTGLLRDLARSREV